MKDEELTQIVITVKNDKSQFELLYQKIIGKVYYWCYVMVHNESLAKDISQEAIIHIYHKLDTVKDAEMFTAWMYRLVYNYTISYWRKHKRTDSNFANHTYERLENFAMENRIDHMPKEMYDLNETKEIIHSLIATLPPKQREVMVLYYLEEFKIDEICHILDSTSGSIRSSLFDGRKNLKEKILEYEQKNSVKLHSTPLAVVLHMLFQDQSEIAYIKQGLLFESAIYFSQPSYIQFIIHALFSIKSIVLAILIVGTFLLWNTVQPFINRNSVMQKEYEIEKVMKQKNENNSYIEYISYLNFPTKDEVCVEVHLKQKINQEDIDVKVENKPVNFQKKKDVIYIYAFQNGEYQIEIKNESYFFRIDNIDSKAPELLHVSKENKGLVLSFTDENRQINYQKSYVEYENKQYPILENGTVNGNFKSKITIVIYNKQNNYIMYTCYLK